MSDNQRVQPGTMIAGLGMLLIGGWLVALGLGVLNGNSTVMRLLQPDRLWPLALVLAGLAFLTQYGFEKRKRGGLIFLGTVLLLCGLFLLIFTLQIGRLGWPDMAAYWPFFPLIGGVAFLMLFLAEGLQDEAVLQTALLVGGVGLFALPFTLGVITSPVFDQVARLWPLGVALLMLAIFFQMRRRSGGGSRQDK